MTKEIDKCPDLEQKEEFVLMPGMAVERLLALCSDINLITRLGASLPLLVIIIQKCGSSDNCTLTYPEIAEKCGVSSGSIKNWAKSLVSVGLISKTMHGQDGIKVALNLEVIKRLPVFEPIVKRIKNAVDLLNAGKSAVQSATSELTGGLEAVQ
jgi:hypothetical protein